MDTQKSEGEKMTAIEFVPSKIDIPKDLHAKLQEHKRQTRTPIYRIIAEALRKYFADIEKGE